MGKGDKKTKRGKIVIGSSGVKRRRKKKGALLKAPVRPAEPAFSEVPDATAAVKTATKAAKKVETGEAAGEKPRPAKARKKSSADEADPDEQGQDQ